MTLPMDLGILHKPRRALPSQYAKKTSMDLVANLCSRLTLNDSDEETDNDMVTQAFNTTTVEYRAHLEYADSCSSTPKV